MGAREEHPQSPGSSGHPLSPAASCSPAARPTCTATRERGGRERQRRGGKKPSPVSLRSAQPSGAGCPPSPCQPEERGGNDAAPPAAEALQSRRGFPAPPAPRSRCHPPGTAPAAFARRSPVVREAPASSSRPNPPPVPVCLPADGSKDPRAPGPRPRDPRDLHPPSPSSREPTPRPTHPRGNSTPLGEISRGDVEAHVPGGCRVLSIPAPDERSLGSSCIASHHGDAQPGEGQPTPHFLPFFFFFPPKRNKNPSNLPSSAPTRLVYFEPGLQNRAGEAGGK